MNMHLAYKLWLELGGQAVFGMGLYQLLSCVQNSGSLHKAAEALHMSYRAAWGKIRSCEERLGADLLEKGRCGRNGSHLTVEGETLVNRFRQLLEKFEEVAEDDPVVDFVSQIKHEIVPNRRSGKDD